MDYNKIKTLLNNYFEGETSLAEEEQLRQYFKREDIPNELRKYQSLFAYFGKEQERVTSSQFNQRWSKKPPARRLRLASWWSVAAAVVFLLVASWFFLPETDTTSQTAIDWSKYEPKTETEALQVTKRAFLRTSSAMYQGLNQAASEVENVKKIMNWE